MALGDGVKHPYASEDGPLSKMVKRIVAARDLTAGTLLKADDLEFRIPAAKKITADSLCPADVDTLVGKVLTCDMAAEDVVTQAVVRTERKAAVG
jgi:N-acetylneuraminate synthase/sialic acid synthase